jgi:CRP/FNR family transcriptional regulator, cyclic AMP receptor protein
MKKVLFLLGELNDDDIDWLIQTGTRLEVAAGTILIREGKPIDALYILLTGSFTVSVAVLQNREVARLYSGEVVGEMSFLDSRLPSATVQAIEDSLVLSIPRQQLAAKLRQDVGFAYGFYRALAILLSNRLRRIVNQLGDIKDQVLTEAGVDDLTVDTSVANIELANTRFDWLLRRLIDG